jgi:hypothetical protein
MVVTDVDLETASLGDRYDPRSRTPISVQTRYRLLDLLFSLSRRHLGSQPESGETPGNPNNLSYSI